MRLVSLWVRRFFGLTPSNADLILEQIYILVYHLGFTYNDAYTLPVWKREWFIKKYINDMEKMKEASPGPTQMSQPRKNTRNNKIFTRSF